MRRDTPFIFASYLNIRFNTWSKPFERERIQGRSTPRPPFFLCRVFFDYYALMKIMDRFIIRIELFRSLETRPFGLGVHFSPTEWVLIDRFWPESVSREVKHDVCLISTKANELGLLVLNSRDGENQPRRERETCMTLWIWIPSWYFVSVNEYLFSRTFAKALENRERFCKTLLHCELLVVNRLMLSSAWRILE